MAIKFSHSLEPIRRAGPALLGCAVMALLAGCSTSTRRANLVPFPAPPAEPRVLHLKSFNSLSELVPVRGTLRETMLGETRSPTVGTPAGLAFRDNHLYICDTTRNAVLDWNLETGASRRHKAFGDIELGKPVAVALDQTGTMFIADSERGQVLAVDPSRRNARQFRPPDAAAYKPVAVAAGDGVLAVTDQSRHQIDLFRAEDGSLTSSIGGIGSTPGRFYFPSGVAMDESRRVAVADMFNSRIHVFGASGELERAFGQPGDCYGDLGKTKHIAIAPDGVISVADAEFSAVHLFNQEGQLLMVLHGDRDIPIGTSMPFGVAIARSLPPRLSSWVPNDFDADYFLFVSNTVGANRLSLFAIGERR